MIPSDFNPDAIMQRRWTKRLLESRADLMKRRKLIVAFPSAHDRDNAIKAMRGNRALVGQGSKIFPGAGPPNSAVFIMRDQHVRLTIVTNVLDKHRGTIVTDTAESVLTEKRDATLDKGLTISKRSPGSGSFIKVERVTGKKYGVFRSFKKLKKIGSRPSTSFKIPDEDRFAGPGSDPWAWHKDRDSALKQAREMSEMTGERVMVEDHRGSNIKFRLAFDSQQDGNVFMSKFNFNSLFGGGAMGKDLTPTGRAFTRIDLGKKSPFFGSEAYEQNVSVLPERMKAFLWLVGDMGAAIL